MHAILCELHPLKIGSWACTQMMPPAYWREALISGKLIPWLWDLDKEACRRKDQEAINSGAQPWDWQLLVRTLAQKKVFEVEPSMVDAPLGLRNRRRICGTIVEIFEYRREKLQEEAKKMLDLAEEA